ncbi:MAG: OmpA family protein [Bacteroidales bacterium]|nr:OmpA family protein [Bacteroidales bacterium]
MEKSFNSVVKYARKHPEQKLMIYGHTCDIGTLEGNKLSGIKRAEFVKHELFKRGIPFTQMETDTKWYTEPLVSNTTEFNRKINRRVEFCFIK